MEEKAMDEEEKMMKMMGFSTFNSSKNKDHGESAVEGVRKNKE